MSKLLQELKTAKAQVKFLLENYKHARNNDFYLQLLWLKTFGNLTISLPHIPFREIEHLSGKLETVRRVRQKIQNEDKLFLPTTPRVRRARKQKETEYYRVIKKV